MGTFMHLDSRKARNSEFVGVWKGLNRKVAGEVSTRKGALRRAVIESKYGEACGGWCSNEMSGLQRESNFVLSKVWC